MSNSERMTNKIVGYFMHWNYETENKVKVDKVVTIT